MRGLSVGYPTKRDIAYADVNSNMKRAALERFIHDDHTPYPALVKAGLTHVQFETISNFSESTGGEAAFELRRP